MQARSPGGTGSQGSVRSVLVGQMISSDFSGERGPRGFRGEQGLRGPPGDSGSLDLMMAMVRDVREDIEKLKEKLG